MGRSLRGQQLGPLPGVTRALEVGIVFGGGHPGVREIERDVAVAEPALYGPDSSLALGSGLGENQCVENAPAAVGIHTGGVLKVYMFPSIGEGLLQELRTIAGGKAVPGKEIILDQGAQFTELLPGFPVRVIQKAAPAEAGTVELHISGTGTSIVPLSVGGKDAGGVAVGVDVLLKGRLVHHQEAEEEAASAAEVLHGGLIGVLLINGDQGLPALLGVGKLRIHQEQVQILVGQGHLQPGAVIDGHVLSAVLGRGRLNGLQTARLPAAGGEGQQTDQNKGF